VLLNGQPIRSCQFPVSSAEGAEITTIEGLSPDGGHPVQQAWVEEQVPQCGYCQSGQILSAVALLATGEGPTDADIDAAMSGNVCRCGTYGAIRRAIHRAADLMDHRNDPVTIITSGLQSADGKLGGDQ
jgi:isoquinoline 1-oxidoreductase alpha subunit